MNIRISVIPPWLTKMQAAAFTAVPVEFLITREEWGPIMDERRN